VCFLFLWSIPLIITEYTLGRKARSGVVGTFKKILGPKFTWMGAFVAFVSIAITFFYTVIVGWCIYYFFQVVVNPLPLNIADAMATWDNYQNSNWPFFFHALATCLAALAIWKGIKSIEKINKVLIPILLVIVIFSVLRALTLPGAWKGISYLFNPQWSQLLQPKVWLAALTQNAWDTGAGWGLFMTYAAYMKKEHGTVKNAFLTGIGNNTISILAALMIFGTVFAVLGTEMGMAEPQILEIMRTSGPASTGLTFIWMPQLFARMVLGSPLAILFFLGLTFAGFSSLIAMLELPTRVLVDSGVKRKRAIIFVVAVCYLLGIPSAKNLDILSNQDLVWGIALMISGAFIAFAVIRYGSSRLRETELMVDENDWKLGRWWELVIKYFVPFAAVILLLWWLSLSATIYAPDQWYNSFNPFSVMSCLVQWFLMLGLFIILNKRIATNCLIKSEGPD
ncbi:MAG: sodium-dependent transporter, partial [Candidatus Aminicenantes bacterium]|nr:sodium-dependent transporter [Candidatus Aminicenantes bacterium]